MNNKRTVEVLKDDIWIKTEMSLLKKGDKFKLYEPDGEQVRDLRINEYVYEFEAASNPYYSANGGDPCSSNNDDGEVEDYWINIV